MTGLRHRASNYISFTNVVEMAPGFLDLKRYMEIEMDEDGD